MTARPLPGILSGAPAERKISKKMRMILSKRKEHNGGAMGAKDFVLNFPFYFKGEIFHPPAAGVQNDETATPVILSGAPAKRRISSVLHGMFLIRIKIMRLKNVYDKRINSKSQITSNKKTNYRSQNPHSKWFGRFFNQSKLFSFVLIRG